MECKDYKEKYGNFRSPKYLQCQSERIKGNKNPGFNHGGSLSPFSETFYIERRGMTLEEAKAAVKYMYDTKKRIVSTNCVEYWTRRGFTEDDAKQKVKERQAVGSLANFQKRHGEEEGLQKWKDRQIKWQNTMKSKPLDERIRINKAKMGNRSYSKVSQVLFVSIYEKVKNIYSDCKFAIMKKDGRLEDNGINDEYVVDINGSIKLLDFYIPSIKKCIEFDGDFYHSEKFRKGNIQRDALREQEIITAITDIQILHINEHEYKKDPIATINKCVEFIMKPNEAK